MCVGYLGVKFSDMRPPKLSIYHLTLLLHLSTLQAQLITPPYNALRLTSHRAQFKREEEDEEEVEEEEEVSLVLSWLSGSYI